MSLENSLYNARKTTLGTFEIITNNSIHSIDICKITLKMNQISVNYKNCEVIGTQ